MSDVVGVWGDPSLLSSGEEELEEEEQEQEEEEEEEDEDEEAMHRRLHHRSSSVSSSSGTSSPTSPPHDPFHPTTTTTAAVYPSSSSLPHLASSSSSSGTALGGSGGGGGGGGGGVQVVEYEQSFGFVEVGDGELEGGGYKLKRNPSTVVLSGDGLAAQQRQLDEVRQAVEDLQVELARLKQQVLEFEEENHEWSLRYSRRMAVLANASLGALSFWSRFIVFVKRHKTDFIQGWLRSSGDASHYYSPTAVAGRAAAPLLLRGKNSFVRHAIIGGGRSGRHATFNKLFTKGYIFAIRHSWVFLLSAYLINKKGFRRWLGLIASTCYSVYLAFFTNTVPWTSYFTIFANLLYITACLKVMNDSEKEVPSLFNLNKASASRESSASAAITNGNVNGTPQSGNGAMHRNGSFGSSRHVRNPSRGSRKIATPLSALIATSPTPSFSSLPAVALASSSSSSPMAFSTSTSSPAAPRMRKNRSNVHFVLDEGDETIS